MANTLRAYIPDSAFAVGGKFYGCPRGRAKVSLGEPSSAESGILSFAASNSHHQDPNRRGRRTDFDVNGTTIDHDYFFNAFPPDTRSLLWDLKLLGVLELTINGAPATMMQICGVAAPQP